MCSVFILVLKKAYIRMSPVRKTQILKSPKICFNSKKRFKKILKKVALTSETSAIVVCLLVRPERTPIVRIYYSALLLDFPAKNKECLWMSPR